ncbi:MAG: hypothetical protein HWE20_02725 [Gammaproteobacteria bacterium]|nr:hypothetical protein [Gammaproteobacteria bacterium]
MILLARYTPAKSECQPEQLTPLSKRGPFVAMFGLGMLGAALLTSGLNPKVAVAICAIYVVCAAAIMLSQRNKNNPIARWTVTESEIPSMNESMARQIVMQWLVPARMEFRYTPVIDRNGKWVITKTELFLKGADGLKPLDMLTQACITLKMVHELDYYLLTQAQRSLMTMTHELPPMHVWISVHEDLTDRYQVAALLDDHAIKMPYPLMLSLEPRTCEPSDIGFELPSTKLPVPKTTVLTRDQWEKCDLNKIRTVKSAGRDLMATGIRNQQELQQLIDAGIDYFEGPHLATGLPAAQLMLFAQSIEYAPWSTQFSAV